MKKLLIIGAGGHGQVVREIAEDITDANGERVYETIGFIDDNSDIAIGKIDEIEKFTSEYKEVIVSIGNSELRKSICEKLINAGYELPVLTHASAYVSRTAAIGKGTVVEPKAIVNANVIIGDGCIISAGAIVDHNATIGNYTQVNSGVVIGAGMTVGSGIKLNEDIR